MFRSEDADESGIHAVAELHGRFSGLCTLSNGKTINNIYWNHLMKECPEVKQFQVVLRKAGGIRMLLRGAGFSPERESWLRGVLAGFLGPLPVELQWVDEIPRTSQGKLVQVVRER
jgi:hypothetical protein